MQDDKRTQIDINKRKETRSKEISKMISEGGLGAHSHYYYHDVSKGQPLDNFASTKKEMRSKEISRMISEGGLGAHSHFHYRKDDDMNKKGKK